MKTTYTANENKYFLGVDGGGTKTVAWIVDAGGRPVGIGNSGSSSPRNVGIKTSVLNIAEAIRKALILGRIKKVAAAFIGLAAIEEEFGSKIPEIKKKLLKCDNLKEVLVGKLAIGSDQRVAFRSGGHQRNGMVVISGTGCVVRGWNGKKDIKASGWGWLADEGSACWSGQSAYRHVLKTMDGRKRKSLLSDIIIKELKISRPEELNEKIYGENSVGILASFSLLIDKAAQKGDLFALKILREGAEEMAIATGVVARKLDFKAKFPVVLIGGMFESTEYLNVFKKKVKNYKLSADILLPEKPPVYGAVKLAEELI